MTQILTRAFRKAKRSMRRGRYREPVDFTSPEGHGILSSLALRPLIIVAHPDDEVFCSGLIRHFVTRFNSQITLACATRGEGGLRAGGKHSAEDLATIRSEELRQAAGVLGVRNPGFFDFEDPRSPVPAFNTPSADVNAAVAVAISREKPTVIITHGSSGEYWHPAHTILHRAAIENLRVVPVLTFNAWIPNHPLSHLLNKDDLAHFYLDSAPYSAQRLQALEKHRSQSAVFEKFGGGDLQTYIEKARIETYHLHGYKPLPR
ncbi:MAG: PIG-L family deacetylase [Verrucomicrobiota bacterium]